MCECGKDPVDREERRDDEDLIENLDRLQLLNAKEGFDIFRGDDRNGARVLFSEYLIDRDRSRKRDDEEHGARIRQQEELHAQRMRHAEEMFTLRLQALSNQQQVQNRDQLQSTAHRDLAVAQEWRDQARDSGESVFDPKQSS